MNNYFMLDGRKIEMSEETAKSLRREVNLNIVEIKDYADADQLIVYINNDNAARVILKEKFGSSLGGNVESGHLANLFLSGANGVWYTKEGNIIEGYLFYKSNC